MKEQTSRKLIIFLSKFAKKLGVAEHVYIVGGSPRNFILKKPIKDVDIVIDSLALNGKDSEWFAKKLIDEIPAKLTTNQYGVAIITIKDDWYLGDENMKGEVIEIANARTESYTNGGYKPTEVLPSDIKNDIYRREFTANTLLWRLCDLENGPENAQIIDLTGRGLQDLKDNKLKCPRDPDIVFSDDATRMIRAEKFKLKYGFEIPQEIKDSIKRNAEKLKNIPTGHLSNMLINVFFEEGIGIQALLDFDKLGLLDVIKEIAKESPSFKQALNNWVDSRASIKMIFDLIDLNMPHGRKLNFLNSEQLLKLRNIIKNMSDEESIYFVDILNQPGKLINMERVIKETGLSGAQIRKIQKSFIDLLLSNSNKINDPDFLENELISKNYNLNESFKVLHKNYITSESRNLNDMKFWHGGDLDYYFKNSKDKIEKFNLDE